MQIRLTLVGMFAILVCLAGCGAKKEQAETSPQITGTVAIIDLDEVARRLGRDIDMVDAIKQRESSLNQQLVTVQTSYQKQLEEKKGELGEQPSEDETKALLEMAKKANLQLNEARRQASGNLTQHRANLIRQFRDETQPIAREIASAKGLTVVITKNDSVVFAYESAVDITDDVIAKMRASQPASRPADRTAAQPATGAERR